MIGHPAAGHVNPTLPVIRELVRRGDRVAYYASEPFRARVGDYRRRIPGVRRARTVRAEPGAGGILGGMAGLAETAEAVLPAPDRGAAARPAEYLLVEAHALWGNLVAQLAGLPTAACAACSPSTNR